MKPLLDSYKTQVADLEAKTNALKKQISSLTVEKSEATARFQVSEQAHARSKEELELLQERVKELELGNGKVNSAEPTLGGPGSDADTSLDLDTELDSALSGSSVAQLKAQVRKLQRERDEAAEGRAGASTLLVTQNMLQDARRLKAKYEEEYLQEHQARLVLARELDEIRESSSQTGDG